MAEVTLSSTSFTYNSKVKNSSGLRKCFQALVDRKQVNLDMSLLTLILKCELDVDLDGLHPNLSSALPYMLIFYIRNWPGWQKSKEYYSGKLDFREWFSKFRQYIILKLNYLIQHGFSSALASIAEDQKEELKTKSNLVNKETQTDLLETMVSIAPFAISIQCPPKMLSSLVFSDSGDDIILSQHQYQPWYPITIKDLINWPHVGVEFVGPEFSFKRYNKSEYRRYVNFTNCHLDKDISLGVENIEIINPSVERQCYTLSLLQAYTQQYNDILQRMPQIPKSKLEATKLLLEAILTDIYEIGRLLNLKETDITIATNTSILFNIGQRSYVRNKKLGKSKTVNNGNNKEVGYCEIFTPKIEFQIDFFKGEQDNTTSTPTFVYLNVMEKLIGSNSSDLPSSIEPVIVFKCLFCDITFDKYELLITHFSTNHGMEPNFVCAKCCNALSLSNLSQVRWKHSCQ